MGCSTACSRRGRSAGSGRTDAGRLIEVWSGGQTGVDRAALDAARAAGVPIGGWIPHGRRAEDGGVPLAYAELRETESDDYAERTERNVRDTDATLILRWGPASGGTAFTLDCAQALGRPCLEVDVSSEATPTAARRIAAWLEQLPNPIRLNVAGPRASQAPNAYAAARAILAQVLGGVVPGP